MGMIEATILYYYHKALVGTNAWIGTNTDFISMADSS